MEDCDASQLEYDPLLGDADTETILKIAKLDVSKIIPKTDEVQRILDGASITVLSTIRHKGIQPCNFLTSLNCIYRWIYLDVNGTF